MTGSEIDKESGDVIKRRCIVLSVCTSSSLLVLGHHTIDPMSYLKNAISQFVNMLKPGDYFCLNMGNSSKFYYSENQLNLKCWQNVLKSVDENLIRIVNRESTNMIKKIMIDAQKENLP